MQTSDKVGTIVNGGPIDKLVRIGFSEYEARAYVALLSQNPITAAKLARISGIPHSMIPGVTDELVDRGAAVTLSTGNATRYAPIPAAELMDRLQREHRDLTSSLKDELGCLTSTTNLDRVWNIEGQANILARATRVIGRARRRVYLATLPPTFPALRPALEGAIRRGVQVVIYTTGQLDLPGGRIVVTPMPEKALDQVRGLGLILIADGQEALISEWLAPTQARASWTSSPTLVAITEQHLVRGGRHRFPIPSPAHDPEAEMDVAG